MSRECRANEVAEDVRRESDERSAEAARWVTRRQGVAFKTQSISGSAKSTRHVNDQV